MQTHQGDAARRSSRLLAGTWLVWALAAGSALAQAPIDAPAAEGSNLTQEQMLGSDAERRTISPSRGSPAETLHAIYLAYEDTNAGVPRLGAVFSRRLQQIIDADAVAREAGEDFSIDYSFFYSGNDFSISDVNVDVEKPGSSPLLRVGFKNMGTSEALWFRMILENGFWVIDDVLAEERGERLSLVPEGPGKPAPIWKARGESNSPAD